MGIQTMAIHALRPAAALPLKARLSPLAFQVAARHHQQQQHSHPRPQPTSSRTLSTASNNDTPSQPAPPSPKKMMQLRPSQRRFLDSALRVNHAGELAATLIYAGQTPPLTRAHPRLRGLMAHMAAQEAGHFRQFSALLARHRVRPTALVPVWRVLAGGLGWVTGALGREAAMACTEAVETEIGEHYNAQVRELLEWEREAEREGLELGEEMKVLMGEIRRIRDEELEHLDHAVENDAKEANPYELLTGVIRAGCRGAIWASERV